LDLKAPQKQMLFLKVLSDNIYHKTKFSHTLCEIWIIPKLCPLSPFASKSGGSYPPPAPMGAPPM